MRPALTRHASRRLFRLQPGQPPRDGHLDHLGDIGRRLGKVTNNLTYTLFGATQWVSQLETPGDQNAALYANLVKGVSRLLRLLPGRQNTGNSVTELMLTLNAAAVSDINAAIKNKAVFAIAGQVSARRARALDLGHDARRLRRTWRRCAPPRGQAPGRGRGRMRRLPEVFWRGPLLAALLQKRWNATPCRGVANSRDGAGLSATFDARPPNDHL